MCDTPVALGNVDVFELAVHIVLRLDKLAAVGLTGIDLNRYLVALQHMWSATSASKHKMRSLQGQAQLTVDSLSNLIGMPIVEVMAAVQSIVRSGRYCWYRGDFGLIPIPLSLAFRKHGSEKGPDIRAVVLDKDNCFAIPKQNTVYPAYSAKFEELRKAYPGSRLLIVSNSAGTGSDPGYKEADLLERNTGVKVLRHTTKKPGCHAEIMEHFRNAPDTGVTDSSQVAIVGDRLFTDVLMANMMGSHGIWIKNGVVPDNGLLTHVERSLSGFLLRRGYQAPQPRSDFE
ncbi:hypothetical protein LTR56_025113 [Elasticomyces elasticus]|nr:hypothetical protein LTR56_025113 [Elasticomyces elasticus]KAK3635857.1 hypothetical protein LTR22_018992 [Elasticomyces elasticus]KAK4919798.1 hypothetical protein LTR49_012545 [Elasticomyces elasticus]KAK5741135.1 hypothetical protein LTS12_024689 [Elasticomyces elasticus]